MATDTKPEDLQSLSVFGIFKESFKLIFKWYKIFLQITFAFIFPPTLIILALGISPLIVSNKIINHISTLSNTQGGYSDIFTKFSNSISSSEWTVFWLVIAAFFIFSLIFCLIFSIIAVSTIAYTIACIYNGKEPTFKKVMSVVPKMWKRVIITRLCTFGIISLYTLVFAFVLLLIVGVISAFISQTSDGAKIGMSIFLIIGGILYFVGLTYMGVVWRLAEVVSVMEKICGIQALTKSHALIKGKVRTTFRIIVVLGIFSMPNQYIMKRVGVIDESVGVVERICYGIVSLVLSLFVGLLSLVVQTVLYFVCKSYHHENVDLADHLDGYHGDEYAPLDGSDTQREHLDV